MGKTIVFGGDGFIGSALCKVLDNYYVSPLELTSQMASHHVRSIINDGDDIVMIAALTAEHGAPYQLTDLNIRMAANVIRGMEGKIVGHIVYVSSDSVYGDFSGVMTESTRVCPVSLYGKMHAMREQMFAEACGETLTILRPCAVYGHGDTHNAYGINQFMRSDPIEIFGEGEELRSNVHVDDVAAVIAMAAQERLAGTFNVNCGKAYTFRELAEMFGKKIISKRRTQPVTHRLVDNSTLRRYFPAPRSAEVGIRNLLDRIG